MRGKWRYKLVKVTDVDVISRDPWCASGADCYSPIFTYDRMTEATKAMKSFQATSDHKYEIHKVFTYG